MQYPILVFLHVLGALGLFAALGIEGVALRGLRREPSAGGARSWLDLLQLASRMGLISMILLVVAGIALTITVWHHQAWISAAFVGIAIMAVLGGAVMRPRLRAVRASVAETSSSGFPRARSSAALATALVVRIAIAVGIVGLMTAKPDRAGSALLLAAAVLAGVVASLPALRSS